MEKDAYSRILKAAGEAGASESRKGALRLLLGTVVSVSPLKVSVAGTVQEAARFYLCDRLRSGHQEMVSVTGTLTVSARCELGGSHSSAAVSGGTLTATTAAAVLKAGDRVLLLTEDEQSFYLIDRVVSAS